MKENFRRKVLKNGLTILFKKRKAPIVSVSFAVRTGGIHEKGNEKGISHFIEHMLYKGTPKRNYLRISGDIENNGGVLNGFTDENLTAFWCKIPGEHLDIALDVLSDMIKNPLFDESEMKKERKVIFEEIKMRRDNPSIYTLDRIHSFLYGKPFGDNMIGTEKTINSITREKIMKRFREIYTPGNIILCVVGNANFGKIARFAAKNFGNKKGSLPKIKISEKNKSSTEKRKGLSQANLVFAYHIPHIKDRKSYTARILNEIMAEGMSSRVYLESREKRNLAYDIKGMSEIAKNFAYNLVYVGTQKKSISEVKKIILEELRKISIELSHEELERNKEKIIGRFRISMEDSHDEMVNLLESEANGVAKEFYDFEKNIRAVRLNDVKNMAKIKKYSFFALIPE